MEKQIDDMVDSLDRRIRLVMSWFRQCKEDPKSLQKVLCRLGVKESSMIQKVVDKIDMPIGKAKMNNEFDSLLDESESQLDQFAEESEHHHADSSPITPGLEVNSLVKKDDASPTTPGLEAHSLVKKDDSRVSPKTPGLEVGSSEKKHDYDSQVALLGSSQSSKESGRPTTSKEYVQSPDEVLRLFQNSDKLH